MREGKEEMRLGLLLNEDAHGHVKIEPCEALCVCFQRGVHSLLA